MSDYLSIRCWKCGTVNSVRADLVQFDCLDCGALSYASNGEWETVEPPARELPVELDGEGLQA